MESSSAAGERSDDLRSLIAGGFPVIIEKGLTVTERDMGWMGITTS